MLEPHKIKGLPKLTHFIYRILIIDLERVLTLRITSKNIAIIFVKKHCKSKSVYVVLYSTTM